MSKLFRQQAAYLRQENRLYPEVPAPLDLNDFPKQPDLVAVWRSNRFLVQMFTVADGAQRISINRTMVCDEHGGWLAGITWDEIQRIKSQIGFGDRHAVEIYPPDDHVVNVANMRHIWLVDAPAFAWKPRA